MLSTNVITIGRQQRVQKHPVTWVHVVSKFFLSDTEYPLGLDVHSSKMGVIKWDSENDLPLTLTCSCHQLILVLVIQ